MIHDIYVDGALLHCQKLNIMRQLKASGEFTNTTIETTREKLRLEMDEAEQKIYEEFGVNEEVAQEWIMKY